MKGAGTTYLQYETKICKGEFAWDPLGASFFQQLTHPCSLLVGGAMRFSWSVLDWIQYLWELGGVT
jgi:hypothetical protein